MRTMMLVVAMLVAASCGTEQQQVGYDEPDGVTPGTIEVNTEEQGLGFGADDTWERIPQVRMAPACEPEIVEIEVPAECPEPEEVLPKMFFQPGGHILGDPSDVDVAYTFGTLRLSTYDGPWYFREVGLYLNELVDGDWLYARSEPRSICEVLDCSTAELVWIDHDDAVLARIDGTVAAIPEMLFTQDSAWEGFSFPTDSIEQIEVRAKIRPDARPGRYYLGINPSRARDWPGGGMSVAPALHDARAGISHDFVVTE